jgi:predicted nucleotidyltransferase
MAKQKNKSLESLSTLTINEKEAIIEFVKILRQRFGSIIREIIFFGSKTRDDANRYSDIDILIVLTKLSWEIKKTISELAAEENLKYGVLISTIRYSVNTWENPVIKLSPFGKAVRNEGIWL